MTTRREFLQHGLRSSAVISVGAMAPRFWLDAATANTDQTDETILVVVQLSGGNDGLNTVVPFADPEYRRRRPNLAFGPTTVLKLNDELGLHPALRGLADLFEQNHLSIVQGVGYPNPNRSHFESMDIWHTCQRKTESRGSGWIGRFLDATTSTDTGGVPALHLGDDEQPRALRADDIRVPSVKSLTDFRLAIHEQTDLRGAVDELTAVDRGDRQGLLGFLQTTSATALKTSHHVAKTIRDYKSAHDYPYSSLAEKLKTVAQLIDAGWSTRVYYVALDGFDTHARQADAHTSLLRKWGDAVSAFYQDITAHGHGERVTVMTFSEFGRRVEENASYGTDHGAAAPMFIVGPKNMPGIIGAHPSLTDLDGGDLKHHTDFRQVYAAVIERWLGWQSDGVLLGKYEPLSLFG